MMRSLKWSSVVVLAMLALVLVALPATAQAMTVRTGDSIVIPKGEVLADDLYAFGNSITIDGAVDGDVIAFGQSVVVNGGVTGGVVAGAQIVRVPGKVTGSVRAAGSIVDIAGFVGRDMLVGANRIDVGGTVGRDLVAGAQGIVIRGGVGRNVLASSETLVIEGTVGGNVNARTRQVTVAPEGAVRGNLDYWSTQTADVAGTVTGSTTRHEPPARRQEKPSGGGTSGLAGLVLAAFIGWVQSLIGTLILGLILVLAVRRPMDLGSLAVLDRPWPSLGIGLLVFFVTPMAAGFVFFFGLLLGAWWLSFVVLAVYWLLLLAGSVTGSLAVGRGLLRAMSHGKDPALVGAVLLGIVLVWIVGAIPFLGWLAAWVVTMLGTGALVLLWAGRGSRPLAPAPAGPPQEPAQPTPSARVAETAHTEPIAAPSAEPAAPGPATAERS